MGAAMIFAAVVAVSVLLGGRTHPASAAEMPSASCTTIRDAVSTERTTRTLDGFAALWEKAQDPARGCGERAIHCLGDQIALAYLDAAYRENAADAPTEKIDTLLQSAFRFGSPWQLFVARGDLRLALARDRDDSVLFSAAAFDYQEALIGLEEPVVCRDFGAPARPAPKETAAIYRRMSTALLLADPLKVAMTRCAPCEWLFLTDIAGFTPPSRPLPITFPTGSARPTATGKVAMRALLECLKADHDRGIVLSGHTDARGPASYNMQLSLRRLETVKRFLESGGFNGRIALEPKGESEPYKVAGGGYSKPALQRLDRRIELRQEIATARNETCR